MSLFVRLLFQIIVDKPRMVSVGAAVVEAMGVIVCSVNVFNSFRRFEYCSDNAV